MGVVNTLLAEEILRLKTQERKEIIDGKRFPCEVRGNCTKNKLKGNSTKEKRIEPLPLEPQQRAGGTCKSLSVQINPIVSLRKVIQE